MRDAPLFGQKHLRLTASVLSVGGDSSQWEAVLWARLIEDPLFELRMAAIRQPAAEADGAPLPGAPTPDIRVSNRVAALGTVLHNPLPGDVPATALIHAANDIARSPELVRAAIAAPNPSDPDLVYAIARAIVAQALVQSRGEPGEGPDALFMMADRRDLVEQVARALVPTMGCPAGSSARSRVRPKPGRPTAGTSRATCGSRGC